MCFGEDFLFARPQGPYVLWRGFPVCSPSRGPTACAFSGAGGPLWEEGTHEHYQNVGVQLFLHSQVYLGLHTLGLETRHLEMLERLRFFEGGFKVFQFSKLNSSKDGQFTCGQFPWCPHNGPTSYGSGLEGP